MIKWGTIVMGIYVCYRHIASWLIYKQSHEGGSVGLPFYVSALCIRFMYPPVRHRTKQAAARKQSEDARFRAYNQEE